MAFSLKKHLIVGFDCGLVILISLFLGSGIAFGEFKDPTKSVLQLVKWETRANGAGLRSEEKIALTHFEIPLTAVTADFAKSIDPKVYSSLVFERDQKKFVRWVINPEDTKWHLELAAYLKLNGIDTTPHQYFTGYLTSSRSLIVVDPATGATFSAKASTNNTGGIWKDKKQEFDDAIQARRSSDMVSDVQRKTKFNHMILLEEPGMLGIEGVDQAVLIRSLGDLPKSETYFLPGFSALHDQTGREIALLNGSQDPAAFWNENYNKPLARAYAELSAHFGLTYDSPHSQNFLIELDQNMKPTGRIVFRDFVDGYAQQDFLMAANQEAFLKSWDQNNITVGRLKVWVGVMHGNVYPSWLDDTKYKQWGEDFYVAYEKEFSALSGVDISAMKNISLGQSGRYFKKSYDFNTPSWKKYIDMADCFFGRLVTRAGVACPDNLAVKFCKNLFQPAFR